MYDFHTSTSGVRFKVGEPRLREVRSMTRWFASSNDALGDNYGLKAEELADLMEAWQSAALDGEGDERPLASAVSELCPNGAVLGKDHRMS